MLNIYLPSKAVEGDPRYKELLRKVGVIK